MTQAVRPLHVSVRPVGSFSLKARLSVGRGVRGFELLRKVCAERGATLCVMAPMRLKVDRYDQAAVLRMERAWLDYAAANGARVLLAPAENVLDVKYGFDTDYHLNEAGVRWMEPRLAKALRPVMAASGSDGPGEIKSR